MREFDLLSDYPVLKKRYVSKNSRTIKNRIIASLRGKSFYDGKREDGYGGFKYDGRWKIIAKKIFDINIPNCEISLDTFLNLNPLEK